MRTDSQVDSTGAPHHQGIDHFFGDNCQAVAYSDYPPHLWRNTDQVLLNSPAIPRNKKPLEGEVCDEDPGETTDLAGQRPEVIQTAEEILRREMKDNALFPVKVPGI